MISTLKVVAAAPTLSITSQLLGVAQLALLLGTFGATPVTDQYFLLFSWSIIIPQVLMMGWAYPSLLQSKSHNPRIRRRLVVLSSVGSAIATCAASYVYGELSTVGPANHTLTAMLAVSAFAAGPVWAFSIEAAATGSGMWLAAVALPANFFAVLALLLPEDSSAAKTTNMALGIIIGNVSFAILVLMLRARSRRRVDYPCEFYPRLRTEYLAYSTAGFGTATFLQTVAATLPSSSLSMLAVVNRLVASAVTTLVSTLLPRLINTKTQNVQTPPAIIKVGVASLVIVAAMNLALNKTTTANAIPLQQLAGLGLVWFVAAGTNAITQRVAMRDLTPRSTLVGSVAGLIVVVIAQLLIVAGNLSLPRLLVCYCLVEILSAAWVCSRLSMLTQTVMLIAAACFAIVSTA